MLKITYMLFLIECCFKNSSLAIAAVIVVDNTLRSNESSSYLPLSFYCVALNRGSCVWRRADGASF